MNTDQINENTNVADYYKYLKDVIKNSYFIASYQRGYRWDTDNIKELLEDIFEGKLTEGNISADTIKSDPSDLTHIIKDAIKENGEPKYCLQPLVVKKIGDPNKYSVIDGQQRLTSLFVILKVLSQISTKKFPKDFSLEYQSRPKSKDFLDNLSADSEPDNIDAAYIKQAFDYTKEWFLEKNREFIVHIDSDEDTDSNIMNDVLASHIYAVLTEQTRFIWDEIDDSSKENEQKIFADRNTGKLDLTDSELIKSLFMNPEYYGEQRNDISDRQTLISEIWDIYENELHKADFWAFIPLASDFKNSYASRTRIDAIFHLLAIKEKETIRTEENGLFKAIQNWIYKKRADAINNPKDSGSNIDPLAEVMHQCWRDVCDLTDGIVELYESNEIYNLLSLYKIVANDDASVLNLYLEILNIPKNERAKSVKDKITKRLFPNGILQCIKEKRYPSGDIKNILIAHNVAIINTTNPIERFPFKFFESGNSEEYIWDREHIYASNEAYIEGADIEEKISVLKLFSSEDSYKKYINYLYDLDSETAVDSTGTTIHGIDAMEISFIPSVSSPNFAADCFDKAAKRYDKFFDIWRCLKLKEISTDLLRRIDIKEEIDDILNEKNTAKQIQKLEEFLQNTDYDDGKEFIFLKGDYLFWDEEFKKEFKKEVEKITVTGQLPSAICWHGFNVDIPNPARFWNKDIEDQEEHDNFRSIYRRKILVEMYDNTGIPSDYIRLENHGLRKPVIVNNNNLQLFISFIKGTKIRIDEKLSQFFIKGDHIDSNNFDKETTNQYTTFADFINDNSMGNMMLLPATVNRDGIYRSANFDGKRKRVSEMKDVFLPVASTSVLLGKYNKLGSSVRQWLMDERLIYLQDMIETMTDYYK